MARRADTFAFGIAEIVREIASYVYADYAAGRAAIADVFALYDTNEPCRMAVLDVLIIALPTVKLRVYTVRRGRRSAFSDPAGRRAGRGEDFRAGPAEPTSRHERRRCRAVVPRHQPWRRDFHAKLAARVQHQHALA